MPNAGITTNEVTPRRVRRIALWKWLLGAAGVVTLLLLIGLGITLAPRWQEWRLVSYIRAQGGEVEYGDPGGIFVHRSHRLVVQGLTLPNDAIRRIDVAGLSKLQSLSNVTIHGSHVDPEHLDALASVPAIDLVLINECVLYGDCCAPLAKLPQLATLNMEGCSFEDESTLASLASCQSLSTIHLNGAKCSDRGGRELAKVKSLTFIDLDETSIGDETLHALATLPQLSVLGVSGTKVTDDGIESLAQCQTLTDLACSKTTVTGVCLPDLAKLPLLIGLALDRTKLTNDKVQHLAALQQLESLSLIGLSLDDTIVPELAKLKNLRSLDLNGSAITDEGAAQLAKLPALTFLGLDGSQVTVGGIDRLRAAYPAIQIYSPNFAVEAPMISIPGEAVAP